MDDCAFGDDPSGTDTLISVHNLLDCHFNTEAATVHLVQLVWPGERSFLSRTVDVLHTRHCKEKSSFGHFRIVFRIRPLDFSHPCLSCRCPTTWSFLLKLCTRSTSCSKYHSPNFRLDPNHMGRVMVPFHARLMLCPPWNPSGVVETGDAGSVTLTLSCASTNRKGLAACSLCQCACACHPQRA